MIGPISGSTNKLTQLKNQSITLFVQCTKMHSISIVTLDEAAYTGAGLHLFTQVLDQFLGRYVHLNSFIELVVLSHDSGKEVFRCKPSSGSMHLV